MRQSYTYTVHQCFYMETQSGRNPHNVFSYMSLRITFIGSTNFLCFPAATGRRLQPPSFSGYNLREAPTPQFSGYNQKEATTPYVLRLQPPILAPSNLPEHRSRMMEPLSHYHCEIYHCKIVPTCTTDLQPTCTTTLQSTCT
jgi:hypothetical protein